MVENSTARAASLRAPANEIELVHIVDEDRQSNNDKASPKTGFPSKLPVTIDVETEPFVEITSFNDKLSLSSFNQLSPQSDSSLSGAHGECYIAENKQVEGADIISL